MALSKSNTEDQETAAQKKAREQAEAAAEAEEQAKKEAAEAEAEQERLEKEAAAKAENDSAKEAAKQAKEGEDDQPPKQTRATKGRVGSRTGFMSEDRMMRDPHTKIAYYPDRITEGVTPAAGTWLDVQIAAGLIHQVEVR